MVENNFIEFITSFQRYLNNKGFSITGKDLEDFFISMENSDTSINDLESVIYLSRTIFTKTKKEYNKYSDLFIKFYKREIDYNISKSNKNFIRNSQKELKDIEERKKEIKKSSNTKTNKKISYKVSDTFLESVNNNEVEELLKKLSEGDLLKKDIDKLKKELSEILKKSITNKNFKEIAKEIQEINKVLEKLEKNKRPLSEKQIKNKMDKLDKESKEIQDELNRKLRELEGKSIEKDKSFNHRDTFYSNNNYVNSKYEGDINLEDDFSKLTDKEKEKIKDFIKNEAIKFRTRATRDIKTKSKNKIDFKTTMKKATETGGIPLRIAYEKPKLNKSKIVIFLDISGSCKNVSELMLHFTYTIKEVFKGGVKVYAFVNSLIDISEFLEINDPNKAIEKIFETIPTRGVYSNYYNPFETFCKNNMSDITKDTIVYFIGDARNNKNPSGEYNIKNISRKSRKTFWFNTEEIDKWGQGDSIIYSYSPYMRNVFEVVNANQLLGAIERSF